MMNVTSNVMHLECFANIITEFVKKLAKLQIPFWFNICSIFYSSDMSLHAPAKHMLSIKSLTLSVAFVTYICNRNRLVNIIKYWIIRQYIRTGNDTK